MKVWVILWQTPEKCSCGIGGVFHSLETAKEYLPDLFEAGEVIEEEENRSNTYLCYTNYSTYSIECHIIPPV